MRPCRAGGIVLLVPFAWFTAVGCTSLTDTSSTSTSTDTLGQPTVEIDPAEFLGPSGVICGDLPGAMHSYVATFFDLGPSDAPYTQRVKLPSSPPTPCTQRVQFNNGVSGHQYIVEIDGYEEPASKLVAACSSQPSYAFCPGEAVAPKENGLCTAATDCYARGCYGQCMQLPRQHTGTDGTCKLTLDDKGKKEMISVCHYSPTLGERNMVTSSTFTPVPPRWTTPEGQACGEQHPAVAIGYVVKEITGCGKLNDAKNGAGTTAIEVNPSAALGSYACLGAPGAHATVSKLAVKPADPTLPEQDFGCPPAKEAHWEQGVAADRSYVFTVLGYENGAAAATLTASCFGTTKAGLTVQAKCDPLLPIQPSSP